ncbi:serine/threonine-protein kinase [Limobrevibacterium gyesilva]|uniref:non-specific serine/threonine protein kinase n=1 Tax=Limobrevibacterium gyesilva TaxID=2991712 RepID=A0AA42CDY6_9PROT|nr:serine/threonine-protein kinase [Limobrevibacterium gyesilva]MCW3474544.1 serine/threonine protein kinase [Limobrevibacterium gyesilva]
MVGVVPELQIGRRLGSGHFGVVFLGQDVVHGQVAVKVLARKPTQSDAEWQVFKTGFLAEAQNLSKATHRNVVQVYHIEELPDGNSIRFCMAYCPGGSLQSAFETGPKTLPTVRKAGTEVLMGLAALHARQMLHRDIKPGNILIDAAGVAQIGDFGLVTDDLMFGYGSQAGYSDHIAYEVWQGGGTSAKSDIWALGMTLFRLIHGKQWYEEAPDPQTIIPNGGFAGTLKWLPHVPKSWRRCIRKMMNDDPASRYQTASQALEALSRLPITPVWSAAVAADLVRWEQTTQTRRIMVEWKRLSPRKHKWMAWSEPLGRGRKMTLAGSGGIVGSRQAVTELKAYFGD